MTAPTSTSGEGLANDSTAGSSPRHALQDQQSELLMGAVARLRAAVMAVVFGFAGGVALFVATGWLVLQGGTVVGPHLGLLSNYFPGYTVTWTGAFVGLIYGAASGALLGWVLAWLYNRLVDLRKAA